MASNNVDIAALNDAISSGRVSSRRGTRSVRFDPMIGGSNSGRQIAKDKGVIQSTPGPYQRSSISTPGVSRIGVFDSPDSNSGESAPSFSASPIPMNTDPGLDIFTQSSSPLTAQDLIQGIAYDSPKREPSSPRTLIRKLIQAETDDSEPSQVEVVSSPQDLTPSEINYSPLEVDTTFSGFPSGIRKKALGLNETQDTTMPRHVSFNLPDDTTSNQDPYVVNVPDQSGQLRIVPVDLESSSMEIDDTPLGNSDSGDTITVPVDDPPSTSSTWYQDQASPDTRFGQSSDTPLEVDDFENTANTTFGQPAEVTLIDEPQASEDVVTVNTMIVGKKCTAQAMATFLIFAQFATTTTQNWIQFENDCANGMEASVWLEAAAQSWLKTIRKNSSAQYVLGMLVSSRMMLNPEYQTLWYVMSNFVVNQFLAYTFGILVEPGILTEYTAEVLIRYATSQLSLRTIQPRANNIRNTDVSFLLSQTDYTSNVKRRLRQITGLENRR